MKSFSILLLLLGYTYSLDDVAWLSKDTPGINKKDTTTCEGQSFSAYVGKVFGNTATLGRTPAQAKKAIQAWTAGGEYCKTEGCVPYLYIGGGFKLATIASPHICFPCMPGYEVEPIQVSDDGGIQLKESVDTYKPSPNPHGYSVWKYNLEAISITGEIPLTDHIWKSAKQCYLECAHNKYCIAVEYHKDTTKCYGRTLANRTSGKEYCHSTDTDGVWYTNEGATTCYKYMFPSDVYDFSAVADNEWTKFAHYYAKRKASTPPTPYQVRPAPSLAQACVPCKEGYYRAANSKTKQCIRCKEEEGSVVSFSSGAVADACVPCSDGTIADARTGSCIRPPAGTYLPLNKTAVYSNLKNCDPGYETALDENTRRWQCVACPRGKYQPQVTNTTTGINQFPCISCDEGTYSSTPHSTTCYKCAVGKSGGLGATNKAACVPGCLQAGQYCDDCENQPCKSCQPGRFSRVLNSASKCTKCTPGKFAKFPGSGECRLCPNGKTSKEGGADCDAVEAGHFVDENGDVRMCKPGTFSHKYNDEACDQCGFGSYQDKYGQSSCIPCEPGTYQTLRGATACIHCNPGMYLPEGASRPFYLCYNAPPGTKVNASGATSYTTCGKNTYTPDTSTNGTIDWQNSGKNTFCTLCEAGRWTDGAIGSHTPKTPACKMCEYHWYRPYDNPEYDCMPCKSEQGLDVFGHVFYFNGFGMYTNAGHTTCSHCCTAPTGGEILLDFVKSIGLLVVYLGESLVKLVQVLAKKSSYCNGMDAFLHGPLYGPFVMILVHLGRLFAWCCIMITSYTVLAPLGHNLHDFVEETLMKVLCIEMWTLCEHEDQCWGEDEGSSDVYSSEIFGMTMACIAMPCFCLCLLLVACRCLCTAVPGCVGCVAKMPAGLITVCKYTFVVCMYIISVWLLLGMIPTMILICFSIALGWFIRFIINCFVLKLVPEQQVDFTALFNGWLDALVWTYTVVSEAKDDLTKKVSETKDAITKLLFRRHLKDT